MRYARKFHSWNPFAFGLSWDGGVPRGIMTTARAYQVLHAEENGDEDCFQQFLKNPTKTVRPPYRRKRVVLQRGPSDFFTSRRAT